MRKTKVTHLFQEYTEGNKTLVGIKVEKEDETFVVPVIDVRTSDNYRKAVQQFVKEGNATRGSRFMRPSYSVLGYSYNGSHKK